MPKQCIAGSQLGVGILVTSPDVDARLPVSPFTLLLGDVAAANADACLPLFPFIWDQWRLTVVNAKGLSPLVACCLDSFPNVFNYAVRVNLKDNASVLCFWRISDVRIFEACLPSRPFMLYLEVNTKCRSDLASAVSGLGAV